LGLQGGNVTPAGVVQVWKDGEGEPDVWVEDLGSSNGTWVRLPAVAGRIWPSIQVNGVRIVSRRLLQHGDEISLGHKGTLDNHDVRYIFRSVGTKGTRLGQSVSKGGLAPVGEVYERYQFLDMWASPAERPVSNASLGSGSFAEVRKAVDVETGDLRAIKVSTELLGGPHHR
jgi:serine/threonine/tyrosine protein kinase RAD53